MAEKAKKPIGDICNGGRSFNCKKLGPHDNPKHKAWCRNCGAYMGCFWCRQRNTELVCLNCHDWALDAGEREHGKMVSRELAAAKVKEILRDL